MIQAIQLILALSFLVLIHELGHFTFARIFHVRVEKFYLFFNPKFSLIRLKKFNGQWHVKFFAKNDDEEWAKYPETTEWGVGWLPFGGYCAICGMVDETHPPKIWRANRKIGNSVPSRLGSVCLLSSEVFWLISLVPLLSL